MNFFESLIQGKLTIHQELINKFLGEALQGHKSIKSITVAISGGLINLAAEIRTGESSTAAVAMVLSLGGYEFNRFNRFLELLANSPVTISLQGIRIKARLSIEPEPPAGQADHPQELAALFRYLNVKEDRVVIDFNKIPGFNRLLQNKLGFVLQNLEIARLELSEGMFVIYPAIKFF